MAKSASLAERLVGFIQAQQHASQTGDGTLIEALGLIFGAAWSPDKERAEKWAADLGTSIGVCFALKEKGAALEKSDVKQARNGGPRNVGHPSKLGYNQRRSG